MMSDLPGKESFDRAAHLGEQLVKQHIAAKIMRRMKRGAEPWDWFAIMSGVFREASRLVTALSRPESRALLEQHLVATVRGAVRGAEGPLNEDGSKFGEW
jgi:hypothetical protein